jgi:DNA helicase II / ATP-dependent DNA helicase PcrA
MNAAASTFDKLNPEQLQAVRHGRGPLLVIAGAGSGKTNTLAHRVAQLVVNGADPRRILLMTFSRRAAAEMTRRVERILADALGAKGATIAQGLEWAGTFHGIGARLLRDYAGAIGLEPAFTIHDRTDSADLMNMVRHELGYSGTSDRFPTKGTCLAIYSRAVNAEAPLEAVLKESFPWCAAWTQQLQGLFSGYVEAKQAQGVLDYDDLLLYWAGMMQQPDIRATIEAHFDHVLVDEYQDTNRLQASILMLLRPTGDGLTVVGDDAQAIYSFRAATVTNILEFPANFSPPAQIVTLERNYRSTEPILAAANAVIALAERRFTKNLWTDRQSAERPQLVTVKDEADQARYVVESVLAERENGATLKQQAVLFRTSSHSADLEIELSRRNIPYVKFGGLKFLEAAHVKDLLSALRFLENPRDQIAGFRLLQLLPGIGPGHAKRIIDKIAAEADPLAKLREVTPPPRSAVHWQGLVDLVGHLRADKATWPGDMGRLRVWYQPLLETHYEDAELRKEDIAQLERIAQGYPSRERFLSELTLDPPEATSDEPGVPLKDEDYLILSTIHSAKGQEWRHVHVLNVVDGAIPSDLSTGTNAEIEEERRLLYVAMTRARDRLHLVTPQRFFVRQQAPGGDRHVYAQRTRFIPRTVLPLFEDVFWPKVAPAALRPLPGATPQVDLKANMRQMWQK